MKTSKNVVIAHSMLRIVLLTGCAGPALDPNIGEPIGRCVYVNGFSKNIECKEYLGSDWTGEAIDADCASPVPGSDPGRYEPGLACDRSAILGQCFIDQGTVEAATIVFPGEPGDSCSGLALGCGFAGGDYLPAAACGGEDPDEDFGPLQPFTPFRQVCVDPLPGTGPGLSEGGQVCTWEAISAATEPGRRYSDYASCEPVLTQRPYWAAPPEAETAPDDPRYDDQAYMAEYAWATEQVQASACTCCHTVADSPDGRPSGWFIDGDGLWTDTVNDEGLAMLAGWIDSSAFGAFPAEQNNGFHRDVIGLPTTDVERMRRFLAGELNRRGRSEADFAEVDPFGGPLVDQARYERPECSGGAGLDSNGILRWNGGRARYLYVLEPWATNPGVPPNLDLPEGTIWRIDVTPDDAPMRSGLAYGQVPADAQQRFPERGAPEPLISGREYTIYALMDVALPITRCRFTAP